MSKPSRGDRRQDTSGTSLAAAFYHCAGPLLQGAIRHDPELERACAQWERSRPAAPLPALARRVAGLPDPTVRDRPEVVVFLGLLADELPDQPQPALALALALATIRAPKAGQALASFQERFGQGGAASLMLGRIRLEQGAPREALSHFEHAMVSQTDATEALFGQGLAWLALGEPARAADALAVAHVRAPRDSAVAYHLAFALGRKGDADAALALLDELTAREPRHAKAWFEKGNRLQDAGRHRDAAVAFAEALAAEPAMASAAFNLGLSRLKERQLDRAMDAFGRAIRLDAASLGPVAQALAREPTGCLWLDPRQMEKDLSGRAAGA